MDGRAPRVEFLWWEGCPSHPQALAELREEMGALGLDPASVELRHIDTDEAAASEAFVGSPTIRIAGADLMPPGDEPIGLSCRVYRLRDGRISAIPDRADVRDALERAVGRSAGAGSRHA
jgi:hypothetical protein